jgi:hypothetical protein
MLFPSDGKSEFSSMILETILTPTYFLIRLNVPSRSVSETLAFRASLHINRRIAD